MDLCSGRTGLSACVSRPKLATTSGPLDGALERTRGALEIAGDDPDPAGGAGEGRGGFTHTRAGRTDRPCCPTPRRQPPRQAGTRRRSKPSSMPAEPPHPAARTGARLHPPPCSRADCAGHRPGSSAASWGGRRDEPADHSRSPAERRVSHPPGPVHDRRPLLSADPSPARCRPSCPAPHNCCCPHPARGRAGRDRHPPIRSRRCDDRRPCEGGCCTPGAQTAETGHQPGVSASTRLPGPGRASCTPPLTERAGPGVKGAGPTPVRRRPVRPRRTRRRTGRTRC